MKIRKSLLTAALALGCLSMTAQNAWEVTEYDSQSHVFVQGQVGGQETLGEGSFGKLLSPNVQIAVGYQFNKLFAARLAVGAWQSKGTMFFKPFTNSTDAAYTAAANAYNAAYPDGRSYWKYNYVAPQIDVMFNLTNALGGFNPYRVFDINLFAGVGLNVAMKNDEANDYNKLASPLLASAGRDILQYNWDGTKLRPLGRFGLDVDFRLTDNLKLGVEFNANFLNDHYNSKKAGNADWYFNGLVGVKYAIGQTFTKRVINNEPQIIERIVEKIVEVPVPQAFEDNVEAEVIVEETMRRDIFFQISSYQISIQEMWKVHEIAEFMKEHPDTKVEITGYADNKTGTLGINVRLAKQRADAVANALQNKYGIPASRMIVSSMKNQDYQPFQAPDPYELNRVAICIVTED